MDLRNLERELASAVAEEHRRVAVDEMKKRAIGTAGSYDEFKNLVACATQKPITSKELQDAFKPRPGLRNGGLSVAAGADRSSIGSVRLDAPDPGAEAAAAAVASLTSPGECVAPDNRRDFDRIWRTCKSAPERIELLRRLTPAAMPVVFKVEVDSTMLGLMVTALLSAHTAVPEAGVESKTDAAGDLEHTRSILRAVAQAPRFRLAKTMLSKAEQASLRELVSVCVGGGEEYADIQAAYK